MPCPHCQDKKCKGLCRTAGKRKHRQPKTAVNDLDRDQTKVKGVAETSEQTCGCGKKQAKLKAVSAETTAKPVRELLIMRHAKSSWKDPELTDHDRPLNKRGRRAAKTMGQLIASEDLTPEIILCSSAKRAVDTVKLTTARWAKEVAINEVKSLYLAEPDSYLELIAAVPDQIRRIMIVGHNPGIEMLLAQLTGREMELPTAALARVRLKLESWSGIREARGLRLTGLWKAREVA